MRILKPQYLKLEAHEDGKYWVAEIIGDDTVYRLQRAFIPEIEKGLYEIYDGYYQIHGLHPGITPFTKEYCIVQNGHMERRIPVQRFYQEIQAIKDLEGVRLPRVKQQIKDQFQSIIDEIDQDWIRDEMDYQWDQVEMMTDSAQAIAGLSQLIHSKDKIIARYQAMAEIRNQNSF